MAADLLSMWLCNDGHLTVACCSSGPSTDTGTGCRAWQKEAQHLQASLQPWVLARPASEMRLSCPLGTSSKRERCRTVVLERCRQSARRPQLAGLVMVRATAAAMDARSTQSLENWPRVGLGARCRNPGCCSSLEHLVHTHAAHQPRLLNPPACESSIFILVQGKFAGGLMRS